MTWLEQRVFLWLEKQSYFKISTHYVAQKVLLVHSIVWIVKFFSSDQNLHFKYIWEKEYSLSTVPSII